MLPNQKNMTVLQVLPSLGSGGGVERGTVEIADTIVAAGGRALVASNGGGWRAQNTKGWRRTLSVTSSFKESGSYVF